MPKRRTVMRPMPWPPSSGTGRGRASGPGLPFRPAKNRGRARWGAAAFPLHRRPAPKARGGVLMADRPLHFGRWVHRVMSPTHAAELLQDFSKHEGRKTTLPASQIA